MLNKIPTEFRHPQGLTWFLLAILLLAACATPTPASLPATAAPSTPTALPASPPASPTAAAAALPTSALATHPTRPFELDLATPVSAEPAAGICMEPEGDTAVVEIYPDAPAPRCLKVTALQRLVLVNRTESEISVSLGALAAIVLPGEEYTLDRSFGEYLAPGVHRVQVTPYFGPEVWLQGE
jgi:hypothetical protein